MIGVIRKFTLRALLSISFTIVSVYSVHAQFYNGHQMTFGKNRVQFNDMYWQYIRFSRFDTYFYEDGRELALFTAKTVERKLNELQGYFGYNLEKRVIFLVFKRISDFRQSNIGLISGNDQYNTGGVTKIVDNKVFLYFEGDHMKFEKQITAAITEVLLNEMLYGQNFREKVTNSTLLNLPDWYLKGLISYISNNWDFEIENIVKDGILNKKYHKFNQLRGNDAVYAGHSIWRFVAETYGKDVIPNIVFMTRVNKNAESGFTFVIGTSVKEMTPLWKEFYLKKFLKNEETAKMPDSVLLFKKPKKNTIYSQVKMSPDKKYIAYTTNQMGKYKVYLYHLETQKNKRIISRENRLEQITDYSYPVMGWHPNGKILTFMTEERGMIYMNNYFTETKDIKKRQMLYYNKVLDFAYSDDGILMVVSGFINGLTDIYLFNTISGTNDRITRDLADDINPRFVDKSTKIVFSSNRLSDSIIIEKKEYAPVGNTYDIFVYDLKSKSKKLQRITNTPFANEIQPFQTKKNTYLYLSDQTGIQNRSIASFDSTISYIDTTTHYRYFTTNYRLTDFPRNILETDIQYKNRRSADLIFNNGKYFIFHNQLNTRKDAALPATITEFRMQETQRIILTDSLNRVRREKEIKEKHRTDSLLANLPKNLVVTDTLNIDINNYVFERERGEVYDLVMQRDSLKKKPSNDSAGVLQQRIYITSFYMNYVVNQVDFGQLNTSYQYFTGGAFYFNPGFNLFTKIGVNDLFEDYKVVGGIRLAGNFDSNEYLLSFENLKKRLDKQFIFHRQAFTNTQENYATKVLTHEGMAIFSYPLNQVNTVKTTLLLRHDKGMFLSTDKQTLRADDEYKIFSSAKVEYIFDNTISLGLNLYNGARYKVFGEYYQQVEGKYTNLFVLGADFRYYQRIHRNLIFATRFAASTSLGKSRLIYYLGGVDNWTPLSPGVNMFDQSVQIDTSKNYVYQAVATNMRGFTQNVRNGENFMLINNEIRFPIFKYIANRPINSDFISNFQIVGFFDAGTAWSGLSPFSKKSAYNNEIIENGPLTITIDKNRPSIVAGYGFGLRSRLFGYFIRLDWAWGIDGNVILPRIFYFSLNLDF